MRLGREPKVRVILLKASGPVFCAGHDLKEIRQARELPDKGRAFFTDTIKKCSALMQAIVSCPKPVIAVVGGTATAAGCQLVASCDLAVASKSAKFATPGVHIGLFCSTPMVALSRNVPRKRAMQMLLTGAMIDADTAAEWGLVNHAVAEAELEQTAENLAEVIASKPESTIAYGLEAFYQQAEMTLADAYDHAAKVMVENMLHDEAIEGVGAFLDKRPAQWRNTS